MPLTSSLSIFQWIKTVIAVLAGSAAVLLAMNALEVVQRVDSASHQRDIGALRNGITLLGEVTAAEQLSISVWDEAFEKVVRQRDQGWMRNNIGRNVYDHAEERILVVGAGNEILFSSRIDGPVKQASDDMAATAASAVVDRVRALYRRSVVRSGAGWEIESERPDALFQGIYDHDLAVVDGSPAMVTVTAFTPDLKTENIKLETPTVLVHVRYLQGKAVTDLGATAQLENVRLLPTSSTALAPSPGRHAITTRLGKPVAVAAWRSEPPGSAVIKAMLPTLFLSLLFIGLFAAGGSRLLKRLAEGLTRREEVAVHASRHDPATGLANRGWFHDRLTSTMAEVDGSADAVGVVLIDLDYFKEVNDTLGHAAGDAVILAAAERMRTLDDESVVAARLGGDEFALVTRPTADPRHLDSYCRKLHALLMQPVVYEGREIAVSASVGATVYPADAEDGDTALLAADLALYRAKRDGRGCYRIYDAEIDGAPGAQAELPAIERGQAPNPVAREDTQAAA